MNWQPCVAGRSCVSPLSDASKVPAQSEHPVIFFWKAVSLFSKTGIDDSIKFVPWVIVNNNLRIAYKAWLTCLQGQLINIESIING